MRSGEPPEHGGGRAHFAVLDPAQRGAADPAPRRKLIERPAPRAPQFAQALGEAQVGGVAKGACFHIKENTLKNESVKHERATGDLPTPALSCTFWGSRHAESIAFAPTYRGMTSVPGVARRAPDERSGGSPFAMEDRTK